MDSILPFVLACGIPLGLFFTGFVAGVMATRYRVRLERRPDYEDVAPAAPVGGNRKGAASWTP